MDQPDVIFKIVTRAEWDEAKKTGVFKGAPVDLADGYIHFSTAEQVRETAAKHFAGQADLLLLTVSTKSIAADLKYEPSRGGQLFPHLYAALPLSAVTRVDDLPLGADGEHHFPDLND
ncbi:MAG: DUF952 domain-containing protein [Geminicoccaceae bacterium]